MLININQLSIMNQNDSIFLVDSPVELDIIKKQIGKGTKILTLDYDAHRTLSHNNIEHEVSDSFLVENESDKIQDSAYRFSNWAINSAIKDDLLYNSVNIGHLFYIELYVFLLEFLKKFIEIQKIHAKYCNYKFLVSEKNYRIINTFTNDLEIISNKNNEYQFHYDSITFEGSYYRVKISRKNYLKLKSFLEKINKNLLRTKTELNNIMLVEFNTIFYRNLFHSLKNHILFFGLRRPPIWNIDSYSIISRSNSQLVTVNELFNEQLKNKIDNGIKMMKEKTSKFLTNENFFKSFFTINGISVWNALKPSFVNLIERHIEESIENIEIIHEVLTKFKPHKILILSESGSTEQIIISKAKELGIPTILLQHGNLHDNPKGHQYNQFTGSVIAKSDQFLVWGKSMLRYAHEYNLPISKMYDLGSSSHDRTFDLAKKLTTKSDFILLSTQGPLNMHVMDHTIKANEEYEKIIENICRIVVKLDKKLVIKLHPYEDDNYEYEIAKKIDPNIKVLKKGDTLKLIQSCSIMISVGTSISSVVYDAHILQKPVLRIPFGEWFGKPDRTRPSSCHNIGINELEATIVKLYDDPTFRKKILENGQIFINDCLSNHGNASQYIAKFLLGEAT